MNVNVKISLTDEERNTLFRAMTGKDSKSMVSRAMVNSLVHDYIDATLKGHTTPVERLEPVKPEPQIDMNFGRSILEHPAVQEEARRINAALLSRINKLQHYIDTRK